MIKFFLSLCLITSANACADCANQQNPYPHKASICDNLGDALSHIGSDKAKSIITGFCAAGNGEAIYIDKLQVTVNVQGDDANYNEKYKYVYDPLYQKTKNYPPSPPGDTGQGTANDSAKEGSGVPVASLPPKPELEEGNTVNSPISILPSKDSLADHSSSAQTPPVEEVPQEDQPPSPEPSLTKIPTESSLSQPSSSLEDSFDYPSSLPQDPAVSAPKTLGDPGVMGGEPSTEATATPNTDQNQLVDLLPEQENR